MLKESDRIYNSSGTGLKLTGSKILDKRVNKNNLILFLKPELGWLSVILSPQCDLSRYPNDYINPSDYDQKMGILAKFDKIQLKVLDILMLIDDETGITFSKKGTFKEK